MQPILVNKLAFSKFPDMSPWYVRPIVTGFATQVTQNWLDKDLVRHMGMIDTDLKKTSESTVWLCGGEEPTAADFVGPAAFVSTRLVPSCSLLLARLSGVDFLPRVRFVRVQAMYFPLLALSKGRAATVPVPESIKAWVAKANERCVPRPSLLP
jgi:hypothetical protein